MAGENADLILLAAAMIVLLLMAVGIFVFIITYLQRGGSKSKPPARRRSEVAAAPDPPPSQPITAAAPSSLEPTESAAPPVEMPTRPGEVMRVYRDLQTGQIMIEVEGKQYAHLREIHDAQVGRRVLWAISDLLRFTGGMAANPQALQNIPKPQEPPPVTPLPVPAQPVPSSATPAPAAPAPAASAMIETPLPRPAPTRPPTYVAPPVSDLKPQEKGIGPTITTFFRRGLQPSAPVQRLPSFIEEIETILQTYIESLPTPLPYEVHMRADRSGTLQIEVGNEVYSSPNDVADEHIRSLIKAAVAEWEKRR